MSAPEMDALRQQWTTLYSRTLPSLARNRDKAQAKWPIVLDHCFARIILDNTIGRGVLQWDTVLSKPAVKHMSKSQLLAAIQLGQDIEEGKADLVRLDQSSLEARGKGQKKYQRHESKGNDKKRGHEAPNDDNRHTSSPVKKPKMKDDRRQSTLSFVQPTTQTRNADESPQALVANPSVLPTTYWLDRIAQHASLTPYRKRLYSTLMSVPRGHYTTYAAMSDYLNSSARAVGNGMRNNPFAPDVPCHRVLAADGTIGGFHGSWGKDGTYASHKINLLKDEGVYFDSRGKVKGPVFRALKDLSNPDVK